MDIRYKNRQLPAGNPLANAIVVVVGVLAIGLSLLLGVVVFVALASLFLVLAAIVGIRLWWARRKLRKAGGQRSQAGIDVIEGEFRVVSRELPRTSRDDARSDAGDDRR